MGNGTQKGGSPSRPGNGLSISGGDAGGKRADIAPGFGRRHRNPKKGPKGSNPKGVEAQREASKIVRD